MRPWLFTSIFLVVGLGLLGGSVYSFISTRAFVGTAVSADGVVVDLEARWDSDDGGYTYYPRVRFVAEGGRSYEFTGDVGSSPASFDVGEEVSVLFDPADPSNAHIDSFMQLWFVSLLLAVMGTIFTAVGGGATIGAMRGSNRRIGQPTVATQSPEPGQTMPARSASPVVERRRRD